MRELFLVESESTNTSLVLRAEDGEEFFIAIDDEVRAALTSPAQSSPVTAVSTLPLADAASRDNEAAATSTRTQQGDESAQSENKSSESDSDDAQTESAASAESDESTEPTESQHGQSEQSGSANQEKQDSSEDAVPARPRIVQREPHPLPEPDPLMTKPMTMRPAEIQNRIRAGASAAELAEEMGVAESRVEPFTHPVMLERNSIAEMAKKAHPLREDGPAKLTLWEILATAFAARGHTLSEATWDARRSKGEPWIISVKWMAGLSENEAEWTLKQSMSSPSTVEARNSVAADLTDPDFVQPVRSLTSIGRGSRYSRAIEAEEAGLYELDFGNADDDEHVEELGGNRSRSQSESPAGSSDKDVERTRDDIPVVKDGKNSKGNNAEEDFLQNPDPKQRPSKRRRKAVTPHWEDVLLGVRANTKRPKK